jgi:allantoinase
MGIDKVKGSIAVGKHADFVIWDPNDVAETDNLHYLYPDLSLVKGRVMFGRIRRTYLRGNLVYADGHVLGPHGQLLTNN